MKQYSQRRFGRRQFLKLGSAGVISATLIGPTILAGARSGSSRFDAAVDSPSDSLTSIGYWDGEADSNFTAASSQLRGSPLFAGNSAQIALLGMGSSMENGALAGVQTFTVDVDFESLHGTSFLAWQYDNSFGAPNLSAPVAYPLPVKGQEGLTLLVELLHAGAAYSVTERIHFTVGSEPGLAKLRDGYYVIALTSIEGWEEYRIVGTEPGEHASLVQSDGSAPDFAYLLFAVEAGW